METMSKLYRLTPSELRVLAEMDCFAPLAMTVEGHAASHASDS
jgi:hypothetical protein